jgi:hypothetical protein
VRPPSRRSHPLLQLVHVERRAGAQRDAVAEVVGREPVFPADHDFAQSTLDDAECDHSVRHVLVRDHGAGVDVARLDVAARNEQPQVLELGVADWAVEEGFRDRLQLGVGDHRVAGEAELLCEHRHAAGERRALGRGERRQRDLRLGGERRRRRERLLARPRQLVDREADLRAQRRDRRGGEHDPRREALQTQTDSSPSPAAHLFWVLASVRLRSRRSVAPAAPCVV